ncbi:FAD-binding oxidoreductase [Trinickia violacea]|uniref:FAD-binding oxidoreductase n=1 Tax=Trinickia violacea TaxID=2571746 RepID=A0A4P8IJS0_9BURK|nr:FAD-binding oxidoreductase [Trinickia violacea]QCP49048.1 FAD-binding oxidoreductase [Trinickia violacea]
MNHSSGRSWPIYRNSSGWNAMLPRREPKTLLPAVRRYDVVVIGAGYTGVAAARRIAEERPGSSILLLESSVVGEGSAGRNSGFVINLPHNTGMAGHRSPLQWALTQIRIYASGLDWLRQLMHRYRIDCSWNAIGKYHAAATSAGEARLRATIQQYADWGIPYTEFDRGELKQRIGTDYYRYGFHSENNVFVQPAALIRGLVDNLPSNVTVLEGTPVTGLSEQSPFHVTTTRCEFTSDKVVVANNGFAKSLGLLGDRLVTIFTYAAMTEQLCSSQLDLLGNSSEWGIVPANRLGSTLRRTQDGRLLVRSAFSYEREVADDSILHLLTDNFARRYPQLESHKFEYFWGGVTALTRNGAAYFGELRPNMFVSVGCNGAGVLKGTVFGKLLGELVAGKESQDLLDVLTMDKPSWLPPEPFRKIAVASSIMYQKALAGSEC